MKHLAEPDTVGLQDIRARQRGRSKCSDENSAGSGDIVMATGGTVLTQVGREGPFAGGHLAGTWTKEASWAAL